MHESVHGDGLSWLIRPGLSHLIEVEISDYVLLIVGSLPARWMIFGWTFFVCDANQPESYNHLLFYFCWVLYLDVVLEVHVADSLVLDHITSLKWTDIMSVKKYQTRCLKVVFSQWVKSIFFCFTTPSNVTFK